MEERELEALARRLGEREANAVNVERIVARVADRLRSGEEVVTPGRFAHVWWLRVAAALVLVVGTGVVTRSLMRNPSLASSHAAHYVAEDLSDLSAEELRQLLNTLDETLDSASVTPDAELEGMTEEQLRSVLRSLEG